MVVIELTDFTNKMQRIYESIIQNHLNLYDQMIFLTGPRQVGKTTLVKSLREEDNHVYLNWDNLNDKKIIIAGYEKIIAPLRLEKLSSVKPVIIFDEIHKMSDWKNFLKGFYDTYKTKLHIIVTGSAKLDVYKKGGDSLMGRYFLYHQFPITLAENIRVDFPRHEINAPQKISSHILEQLFEFGGFPEPFLKKDKLFLNRWHNLRHNQLFREEIHDLGNVRELAQCELLATILQQNATHLVNYSGLSRQIRVSDYAIRSWLNILQSLYYCFFIQPWSKNISRSLLKEPKCYLWDWSLIEDRGAKIENFVACHLFKSISLWTDLGFGKYNLFFVRDKDKSEADFLITKNNLPWILIEVKTSANSSINEALYKFQKQLNVKHALQLAFDMPFIDKNFLDLKEPMIVPLQTFLSQLV
jgi:uncharacterized protein